MAPRLDGVKFNLVRAIERFQDMNHDDMDVMAPTSGPDCVKEEQLALELNKYLTSLIRDGFFDDCAPRADGSDDDEDLEDEEEEEDEMEQNYDDDDEEEEEEEEEEEDSNSRRSTPKSGGFNMDSNRRRGSRDSLSNKFKRYIRRIIPARGSRSGSKRGSRQDSTDSDGRVSRYSDGLDRQDEMDGSDEEVEMQDQQHLDDHAIERQHNRGRNHGHRQHNNRRQQSRRRSSSRGRRAAYRHQQSSAVAERG